MKFKKKIDQIGFVKIFTIIGIMLMTLTIVLAIQITNFSGYGTSENITFTGDQNISRNITIPYNANITSATMNLSGYRHANNNYNFSIESTYIISIDVNDTSLLTIESDYALHKYNLNGTYIEKIADLSEYYRSVRVIGDRLYFNIGGYTDSIVEFYHNLTVPPDYKIIYFGDQFLSGQGFTYNGSSFFIISNNDYKIYEYNNSGDYTGLNVTIGYSMQDVIWDSNLNMFLVIRDTGDVINMYDANWIFKGIYFNTTHEDSSPRCITQNNTNTFIGGYATDKIYSYIINKTYNPYIQINNTKIWNHTGEFNETFSPNKTNDFASVLNTALNGGLCDCTGCVLDGTNCLIETIFHSDSAGKLLWDALLIQYTPSPFVTLESPSNNSYSPATKTFNCSATDEEGLSNLTFYFWNSTGDLNLSTTIDLTGTSNSTTYDMTFNSTGTWTWGCSAINNNSREWWADENRTINIYREYNRTVTQKLNILETTLARLSKVREMSISIKLFQLERIYNFTEVFSRAFNNTVSNQPPSSYAPVGETEINYSKINISDDDYATDASKTEHPYHKFEMAIEEVNPNYVEVLWEGHTSSQGNVSLYVWNYTLANWSLLDSGDGEDDFNLTAKLYDLNNIRDGGNVTFLVQD